MIRAISGDFNFVQKVKREIFDGFVHSIFSNIINIKCSRDGELYSLATIKTDNAPNTIILGNSCFEEIDIKADDYVFSSGCYLRIGDKTAISLGKTVEWVGAGAGISSDPDLLAGNLAIARDYLGKHGIAGGMKEASCAPVFAREMSRMLRRASTSLLEQLACGNLSQALEHSAGLIGLGIGLTPSGDDFLVGLLAVISTEENALPVLKEFCKGVRERAESATNAISYMAIKKASEGRVRESIAHLLFCLRTGPEESLSSATQDVLAIGSTSGTDIACGILRGLELILEIGGQGHGTQSRH